MKLLEGLWLLNLWESVLRLSLELKCLLLNLEDLIFEEDHEPVELVIYRPNVHVELLLQALIECKLRFV